MRRLFLVPQGHFDDDCENAAELARLDQRHIAGNDAATLEPAHALKAGTRTKRDARRQFLIGNTPVELQRFQDFAIDAVEVTSSHGAKYTKRAAIRVASASVKVKAKC